MNYHCWFLVNYWKSIWKFSIFKILIYYYYVNVNTFLPFSYYYLSFSSTDVMKILSQFNRYKIEYFNYLIWNYINFHQIIRMRNILRIFSRFSSFFLTNVFFTSTPRHWNIGFLAWNFTIERSMRTRARWTSMHTRNSKNVSGKRLVSTLFSHFVDIF